MLLNTKSVSDRDICLITKEVYGIDRGHISFTY